jgi:hypothetical protein
MGYVSWIKVFDKLYIIFFDVFIPILARVFFYWYSASPLAFAVFHGRQVRILFLQ